jgi:hypothetical protein
VRHSSAYDTWISGSDVNSFSCYSFVSLLDPWLFVKPNRSSFTFTFTLRVAHTLRCPYRMPCLWTVWCNSLQRSLALAGFKAMVTKGKRVLVWNAPPGTRARYIR